MGVGVGVGVGCVAIFMKIMESVFVVTYLNISLPPCRVNILESGPLNETQWTV